MKVEREGEDSEMGGIVRAEGLRKSSVLSGECHEFK